MSKNYEFDPNEGPHAASRISDQDLEYLHRIISLEMAIRTDGEAYAEHFHGVAEARKQLDEHINQLREDRDKMHFIAAVEATLANLSLTTDEDEEESESYGLYL